MTADALRRTHPAHTSDRVRTIDAAAVTAGAVLDAKAGRTVSVCVPCRDEAATVGSLVSVIRSELIEATGWSTN